MARHQKPNFPNLVDQHIDDGHLYLSIKKTIGTGSNGIVFLAEDLDTPNPTPQEYAVKCVPKAKRGTDLDYMQRQEVKLHSKVRGHPNVLGMRTVIEDDDNRYIVTDYCPGGDLYTFLSGCRPFRRNDAYVKKIFLQIIDAVEACHNRSVFHRDIKPENILMSADKTKVYLCDFGLSTSKPRSHSHECGSSHYMSPECASACAITCNGYSTRQNDVWALGVILLSMICGHNPWNCAKGEDPCYSAFQTDNNYLGKVLPISATANNILQRIFMREPSRVDLPMLRLMIINADTFFMPEDQISQSNEQVKNAAARYFADPVPGPQPVIVSGSNFSAITLFSNSSAGNMSGIPASLPFRAEAFSVQQHDGHRTALEITQIPRTQPTNEYSCSLSNLADPQAYQPFREDPNAAGIEHELPRDAPLSRPSLSRKYRHSFPAAGFLHRIFNRFSTHSAEH
ncbi:Pkinase-domain-containing protein [Obba rivulosa]|uniref:Pkinase-domain-containing protein n=1 Tax=Obba rivulosa TaxID=1052685 RepID=A0A8E2DPD9_9APHY|nr:Pkinase-domain-containing protein [Obba rivulosa]